MGLDHALLALRPTLNLRRIPSKIVRWGLGTLGKRRGMACTTAIFDVW